MVSVLTTAPARMATVSIMLSRTYRIVLRINWRDSRRWVVHDGNQRAGLDRLPSEDGQFGDDPITPRAQLVLHLHGFDDGNRLPRADRISFVDQHPDDLAGHRGEQALGARAGVSPLLFSAGTTAS